MAPLLALALQWTLWSYLQPHVWLLFYPAVFVSSWIGGRTAGWTATVLSLVLAWWFFVPRPYSFVIDSPGHLLSMGVFVSMGILFSLFHDRLRKAYAEIQSLHRRTQEFDDVPARVGNLPSPERVTDAASRSEERIRQLVEQASDGIFVADLDGRYTDVNGAGCRMLGYAREEIVGKSIVDLIPTEEVDRLRMEKEKLLAGGALVSEWKLRRKDGSWLPVEVSAKILPDGRWQGFVRDIADRKAVERERRAWQERLDGIISIAADAIISIDENERILMYNEGARQIFGWTREEMIDQPIKILIPERFRAIHHEHVRGFARESVSSRQIGERVPAIVGRRKNGEEFVAEAAISKLEIDGSLTFTVVMREVTERRRIEEALRLGEERFRVSLQGTPVVVFNQDADLKYTWVYNPPPPWTLESMLGKSDADLLGPDEARVVTEVKRRVLDIGERVRKLVRVSIEDEPRYFDVRLEPLRSGGGAILGLTGAAWDVTDRKREEDKQRLLADTGTVLMSAGLDPSDTLKAIAHEMVRGFADCCIVDMVAEEGTVKRLEVAYADPSHAEACHAIREIRLDPNRPHLLRSAFATRRAELIPEVPAGFIDSIAQSEEHRRALTALHLHSLMAIPMLARGQLVGAIGFLSSRPERRFCLRDLRLAEEIAMRAALAVDNARLCDAAGRAIRSRDEVLAVVAHDLRNPLAVAQLNAGALLRMKPDDEQGRKIRESAEAIGRSMKRADRLIGDLLDVTRIESGRLRVERAPIPSRELVLEAATSISLLATEASLDVRTELAESLPPVLGDRERLLQVFSNLLANAVKFTPAGGGIRIGAGVCTDGIRFWVADTGPGILPEEIPHVFERFWQGRRTDRRGAGLGLAIVKGIVEAHGGRVWVESRMGEGTTFQFTVPLAPE